MPIRHTVQQGDSLWSLAYRYLGSGTRYPKIIECHNNEIARFKLGNKLIPIKNENLIYVGQTLLIPPKEKNPAEGTGTKTTGGQIAVPVNLKVEYAIGKDTPPIVYGHVFGDYSIKVEMSGKIAIEMSSADRYRHSLELLMSKDQLEAKQKLHDAYDPAIRALTVKPEMVFDYSRVKIKAPIAAQANLGPYTIEVQAESPNHMSGAIKPPVISGNLTSSGKEYKYDAEIELKADVIWHPKPRGTADELARKRTHQEPVFRPLKNDGINWEKVAQETGEILTVATLSVITAVGFWYGLAASFANQTTTLTPFMHTINPTYQNKVSA